MLVIKHINASIYFHYNNIVKAYINLMVTIMSVFGFWSIRFSYYNNKL